MGEAQTRETGLFSGPNRVAGGGEIIILAPKFP
jgi:hypothetical protein